MYSAISLRNLALARPVPRLLRLYDLNYGQLTRKSGYDNEFMVLVGN